MIYYAHSLANKPESEWQTLISHLESVGLQAAKFAEFFKAQDIAHYTGLLHDLGKYTPEFAARLRGGEQSVDHATAGAKVAFDCWGHVGKLMAYCIAGHHAGLANGDGEGESRRTLKERLALPFDGKVLYKLDDLWRQEISLPEKLVSPILKTDKHHPFFSYAFFTRMLYSCLVDADFLDTEFFYAHAEKKSIERGNYPSLIELQQKFNIFISTFRERVALLPKKSDGEKRNAELNHLRSEILDYAISQARQDKGLFTLTVPTGGGKTFTSMAFALEHAKQHGMRRVIYVIPFTSIIEQNAAEFRRAFGELGESAVLEHHCTFDDNQLKEKKSKDKLRLASENWDMPIIVTTAVQFFESLFADRSSRCRKLHNITGSVIILDEAQMLPLPLLLPIMQAIKELAQNYHCSVVMCTATQPAIQTEHGFYRGFENVREIAPNPFVLFEKLRRTNVQYVGEQLDKQLLDRLDQQEQLLIIVNNRHHARSLYESAKSIKGTYLLTTLMCAIHRSQVLRQIRDRLKAGKPCRVIATSLIEAGVDVDFPCVMRAEAGLDSVAQAAGRCNREGKRLAKESMVWVFKPDEKWKMPPELKVLSAAMRSVVRRYSEDLLSVEAIKSYFAEVYEQKGKDLDQQQILKMCHDAGGSLDFPFQTIARRFNMIESRMKPLIIPFNKEAEKWLEQLHYAEQIGGLLRKLQPYTVQIPESALMALYKAGRIELINEQTFGKQFFVLIGLDLYDDLAGLSWDDDCFLSAEGMVF